MTSSDYLVTARLLGSSVEVHSMHCNSHHADRADWSVSGTELCAGDLTERTLLTAKGNCVAEDMHDEGHLD